MSISRKTPCSRLDPDTSLSTAFHRLSLPPAAILVHIHLEDVGRWTLDRLSPFLPEPTMQLRRICYFVVFPMPFVSRLRSPSHAGHAAKSSRSPRQHWVRRLSFFHSTDSTRTTPAGPRVVPPGTHGPVFSARSIYVYDVCATYLRPPSTEQRPRHRSSTPGAPGTGTDSRGTGSHRGDEDLQRRWRWGRIHVLVNATYGQILRRLVPAINPKGQARPIPVPHGAGRRGRRQAQAKKKTKKKQGLYFFVIRVLHI